jgi:hypothetical protein
MIVTIKTASASSQTAGLFEAMKYGLEAEPYPDNTFDLVAHDMIKVNAIADYCKGKIVSIVDGHSYPAYE